MESALLPTYRRADVEFKSGEGMWLHTRSGARYLDFGSGVAVNSLGHRHPVLVAALTKQADTLWHLSNNYRIPGGERLARRLADATFADTVFFTNSGAEAVECAIKMARRYHSSRGEGQRYRIITFDGAFHGRTLATIAAGGQPQYLEGFGPKVEGFDQLTFGDWDAIERAVGPATGALLIEPVQGEGGLRAATTGDLQRIRSICDKHDLLLIMDEVQCGVGRTGRLFAHEWAGVTPDIMAIAKGIGGGFPMGACLATAEASRAMTPGSHGSTFGGNPLAMAVGNAVLDVIQAPGFLGHVEKMGLLLQSGLRELAERRADVIEDVRGFGLMLGMKMRVPNTDCVAAARDQGLLIMGGGNNCVRLLPPLIVSEPDIVEALKRLDAACAVLATRQDPLPQAGRAASGQRT